MQGISPSGKGFLSAGLNILPVKIGEVTGPAKKHCLDLKAGLIKLSSDLCHLFSLQGLAVLDQGLQFVISLGDLGRIRIRVPNTSIFGYVVKSQS